METNCKEHQNQKTEKPILKIAETTKPKIPMPPSTSIFNHYNITRSPIMRSPLKP